MTTWVNEDGLRVKFNLSRSNPVTDGSTAGKAEHTLEVMLPAGEEPGLAVGGDNYIAHLPAGAYITGAYLIAETGYGTDTGTLSVGLVDATGTAISATGIDNGVDVSVVLANDNDVVVADGSLVDGTTRLDQPAWIYATTAGTIATGTTKVLLKYIVT